MRVAVLSDIHANVPALEAVRHLVPALAEFDAQFPKIHVKLSCTNRTVDLGDERFDLGIRVSFNPASHLVARKRLGFQVMVFLIVLAGLLYFTKKKVWHQVEKPRELAHGQDPGKTTI